MYLTIIHVPATAGSLTIAHYGKCFASIVCTEPLSQPLQTCSTLLWNNYSHTHSFRTKSRKNDTELFKYMWDLQDNNQHYQIKWDIVHLAVPYKCGTRLSRRENVDSYSESSHHAKQEGRYCSHNTASTPSIDTRILWMPTLQLKNLMLSLALSILALIISCHSAALY